MSTITTNTVTAQAEEYVRKLLSEELTPDHRYHDLAHTLTVREAAVRLGKQSGLSPEDLEVLEIAALFHDVGYTVRYQGHEEEGARIAREFLAQQGYDAHKIDLVAGAILSTDVNVEPVSQLHKLLCDADMSNLGSATYLDTLKGLRAEWVTFLGETYKDEDWYKLNRKFIKKHNYHTAAGKALYSDEAEKNRSRLKKLRKASKERGRKTTIHNSKAAQMMFKTSLRNHLDLSTLADNKANIMLSVNALIITIVMPMAISYATNNVYLIAPMISLLVTCLASMIFATLATRPIKMEGSTDMESIKSGRSNLFFFGNFYKMQYDKYQKGILEVVNTEASLEDSAVRDLFFLGKSLGTKYHLLRVCYTIFMIGIVVTVIIFGFSYNLYLKN